MNHSVVDEFKTQARITLKYFNKNSIPAELQSLLKREFTNVPSQWKLKDCLQLIAKWHGFENWQHAVEIFSSKEASDFGTFWSRRRCGGFLNHWFVTMAEAKDHQSAHGGYIIGFRNQFIVVEKEYVEVLGTEPQSKLWPIIDYDAVSNITAKPCQQLAAQIARKHSITKYMRSGD